MSQIITLFKDYYAEFGQASAQHLSDLYCADIVFKDPLHELSGLEQLKGYFSSMNNGLELCDFVFDESCCVDNGGVAWLKWTMNYRHKKLASGKPLSLEGASVIRYQEKITYHEDFYDLGAMIYQQVPVLGFVVKKVNAKLIQ